MTIMTFLADWWDKNKNSDYVRGDDYHMFTSRWWIDLQNLAQSQNVKLDDNFYVRQCDFASDLEDVKRYYQKLLDQCKAVLPYAPNDPLLPEFVKALIEIAVLKRSPITWCSKIQKSMNQPRESIHFEPA